MNDIESVELTLWNSEGDSVSIDLEPWQVKAIVTILGLSIEHKGGNVYDVTMLGKQGVETLLKSIVPHKKIVIKK